MPGSTPIRLPITADLKASHLLRQMSRSTDHWDTGVWVGRIWASPTPVLDSSSIWPMANRPMSALIVGTPPIRLGSPNMNRPTPLTGSRPTVETSTPISAAARPFSKDPCEMPATQTRPTRANEKYSTEVNDSATLASIGAMVASSSSENSPPTNEHITATESARSPSPARAIW